MCFGKHESIGLSMLVLLGLSGTVEVFAARGFILSDWAQSSTVLDVLFKIGACLVLLYLAALSYIRWKKRWLAGLLLVVAIAQIIAIRLNWK